MVDDLHTHVYLYLISYHRTILSLQYTEMSLCVLPPFSTSKSDLRLAQQLEGKLRKALAEVEARERALKAREESWRSEHAQKLSELQLLQRRLREESKHQVRGYRIYSPVGMRLPLGSGCPPCRVNLIARAQYGRRKTRLGKGWCDMSYGTPDAVQAVVLADCLVSRRLL